MKTFAVIPAAGKGSRAGFSIPKQYMKVGGKEIILYTLQLFQKNRAINEIIIAAEPEYFNLLEKLRKKYRLSKVSKIVEGGKERQDSVFSALSSISAEKKDLIVVHDAARPLLNEEILKNALEIAAVKGNAVVSIKARDTLFLKNQKESRYLERQNIFYIQTPQIFTFGDLMNALKKAEKDNFTATDESSLISAAGKKINFVEGSLLNFKITTKEDLQIFKKLIK